jgi:aminopeptidase N
MVVRMVKENNESLTSVQRGDSLTITLKEPAVRGQVRTFEITYRGIPADGLIISRNKYGYRTFFADNWPDRAHHWIPCRDELGDKATFEFIVTAPFQYKVISNGKLEEEKNLSDNKKITHWKEEVPLSTKVMVIGVTKFAVKQFQDSPPNIPVSAWTYSDDSTTGFRNYAPAPTILKFFAEYVGPYPYNKLANVQSKTKFTGMENASAIFYHEESAEESGSVEDLLAHEIAHQWFGDMATEKSFAHLWLSEGFANYLTEIYLESKYGSDNLNTRLREQRAKVIDFVKGSRLPVVDSVSSLMKLLSTNTYERGAWVLHMLRRELGDSAFRDIIRTYYDRFKGKNADTDDLKEIAQEVTGKNLEQFFKQWLYSPDIPQLNLQWNYSEKTKSVSISIAQQQRQPFEFPLQVQFRFSNGNLQTETLIIKNSFDSFSIPVKDAVSNASLDPNTSLLFEGKIEKLRP